MDIFDIEDPFEMENGLTVQGAQDNKTVEALVPPAFIDELNPEQKQAVQCTEGPLLVLSGAGTGKTKVLTTRIAYLIYMKKAYPSQILAVTFTNKASREMKTRLEKMIGPEAFSVWLGTFHAIGMKILRRYGEKVGLQPNFIVLGSDDQERLIKQLMQEGGVDIKKYAPSVMLDIIQRWKDKGLQPYQVTSAENSGFCQGRALSFYEQYQQKLQSLNAVDFGDLLLLPLTLFQNHPDVLSRYQSQFRYILVDEYQDTNVAQYLLLRLLAKQYRNICCVGDDDQSIYSWRGAEVENILSFQKIFPDAQLVRLERNYRSTAHILGAASALIAHNSGRLGKTLRPADEQGNVGDKVLVKGYWNGLQEAEGIVQMIEESRRLGIPLSEMAILVRASFQTRLFEEVLMRYGVPYKIIGGFKFYEREEIKDAVAYLRLVFNTHDDLAFLRIVNKPKRGIGAQAIEALNAVVKEKKLSLFDSVAWASLRPAVRKTLDAFVAMIKKSQELVQTEKASEMLKSLLEESGYIQMWKDDKSPDSEGRLENIQELYNVLDDFDDIQSFIEYTALVTDTDESQTDDQLVVMTLHASKGLEFKQVYLPGWEEGLFPHQKAIDETGDLGLEEERRLAYVGITRAKKKAVIAFANNRKMYGQWLNALPSRFIEELPQEHVETELPYDARPTFEAPTIGWGASFASREAEKSDESEGVFDRKDRSVFDRGAWGRESSDNGFESGFEKTYRKAPAYVTKSTNSRLGKRVRHELFGEGTVVREEGERLDVRFDSGALKKIMASFLEEA